MTLSALLALRRLSHGRVGEIHGVQYQMWQKMMNSRLVRPYLSNSQMLKWIGVATVERQKASIGDQGPGASVHFASKLKFYPEKDYPHRASRLRPANQNSLTFFFTANMVAITKAMALPANYLV
jgi:hypothetical protein